MYNYKLPQKLTTDRYGYEALAKLYYDLSGMPAQEVSIDFDGCEDFGANLVSAIGAILDIYAQRGFVFYIKAHRGGKIYNAISRNQFLGNWDPKVKVKEKENFIIYRKFHRSNSDDFKQYIDEWLIKKQKFPRHTKRAGEKIQESIYEIYTNAIIHGETIYVYSCGEYNPVDYTLDMTIVDCGKTIPSNVNNYMKMLGEPELEPQQAIDWAFVDGNTTKQDTGGLGLWILKDFIRMNKGCLHMISGNAFLEFTEDKNESVCLDTTFPGTIVNMKFRFDDDKNYYMESEKRDNKIDLNDLL